MTDQEAIPLQNYPPDKILDAVFLSGACEALQSVLRSVQHEVSYFRKTICHLPAEPDLPTAYRAAYGRIVSLLSTVEQAVKGGITESNALYEEIACSGLLHGEKGDLAWSPALVDAAKEVIRQINAAESHLIKVVKSARSALIDHAEQGLIDWSMPFDCSFSVLFNPGPARRIYEIGGEYEEPMCLRVEHHGDLSRESPLNDETYNSNIFRYMENHPLRDGRHCYLVHCLLEHTGMPWQLLPYIKKIEVKFSFKDWETAWAAPISPPSTIG